MKGKKFLFHLARTQTPVPLFLKVQIRFNGEGLFLPVSDAYFTLG